MAINKINLYDNRVLMKFICTLFFLSQIIGVRASTLFRPILINPVCRTAADTDTIVARKQSISAGVSFGSDASFFGRTGPVKYPFLNTDVIYNAKSGVFVYGSAYKVLGSIPAIDEIEIGRASCRERV